MFDIETDEAGLIDEIGRLERVKSAAAAGQARLTAALAEKRRTAEAGAGVPRAKQCRGLASEVGLARHDSPARGGRHLGFATALVFEMPHTLAALECGALSEWRGGGVVKKTGCLEGGGRGRPPVGKCGDVGPPPGEGEGRVAGGAQ